MGANSMFSCALGMEKILAFAEKFPFVKCKQEYGMTETTGCISSLTAGDDAHADSSGLLFPCWEAMVMDLKTKRPLSLRMTGELWVRGPSIKKGYVNNPKETEEAIGKNGWLRTGDIVKFDADGYLYFVYRLKELVKYKGYQVAPAELEDLLSYHPAVLDCAIIPQATHPSSMLNTYLIHASHKSVRFQQDFPFSGETNGQFISLQETNLQHTKNTP